MVELEDIPLHLLQSNKLLHLLQSNKWLHLPQSNKWLHQYKVLHQCNKLLHQYNKLLHHLPLYNHNSSNQSKAVCHL